MKIKFPTSNYIVFDFETTGLNPAVDSVIQMSAIKIENGVKKESFNRFVKVSTPLPDKIVELTQITNEMLEKEGVLAEIAWKEFDAFIGPNFAMIGHNIVNFDVKFLVSHYDRFQIKIPMEHRYIDTAMLFKAKKLSEEQKYFERHFDFAMRIGQIKAYGIKFNLGLCCKELGIDVSMFQAHRADSDIEMTNLIYRKFIEE